MRQQQHIGALTPRAIYETKSTGEVPGMHSQEELEPLLAPLKEQMREDGNHKTTYDFFVSRVQKNLHVALCMVRAGGISCVRRRSVRSDICPREFQVDN